MAWQKELVLNCSCLVLRKLLTGVDLADMDDNTE